MLDVNKKKKVEKLFDYYKNQANDLKGLHYIITKNYVNNPYGTVSTGEIDYIWTLYKNVNIKNGS